MNTQAKYNKEVLKTAKRILKQFNGSKEYASQIVDITIDGLKADHKIEPIPSQTFQFWDDVRAQINK